MAVIYSTAQGEPLIGGVVVTDIPITLVEDGHARDVVVCFGPGATVAELCGALGRPANPSVEAARLSPGAAGVICGRDVRLDDLAHGHAREMEPPSDDRMEVAVVGGLWSGQAAALSAGSQGVTIGRGAGCDLRLDDREVSRVHASVRYTTSAAVVEDLHSSNGTLVREATILEPTAVELEEPIVIGRSVLAVRRRSGLRADIELTPDGRTRFNRPPRTTATRQAPVFSLPSAPPSPTTPHVSIVAGVAPLALGVAIAVVSHQPTFLLFSVFSPVVIGANAWSNRRRVQRDYAKAMATYDEAKASVSTRLNEAVRTEEVDRRRAAPDPTEIRAIASMPMLRLWERRPADADFLDLRLGLADVPSGVVLTGPGAEAISVPQARLVPVKVGIREAGVVGVAGPRTELLSVARALLVQLAALHSPDDLSIVLLSDGTPDDWDWFKWLPHSEPRAGQACRRLVGFTPDQRQARIAELLALIEERAASQPGPAAAVPAAVVVLDGARQLRADDRVATVLRDGPGVGVYAIGLADDRAGLPGEGNATVLITGSPREGFALDVTTGKAHVESMLPDGVEVVVATEIARNLAPLFLVSGGGDARRLPDPPLDELSLLALSPPSGEELLSRWKRRGVGPAAVVGADADGSLVIDLQRDGPHALVAGATGAGKSELLQTLVGGLAAGRPPTELTFLLVDFKGGSAFRECEQLPHTVGVITNLDGRLVARALDSIQAELRWRQAMFMSVGAKDFDEYRALGRADRPSIPRLVIVVDELKELVDAYSEAIARLSQTARLGRSLGVHLVLATQKPSSVSGLADLRANTDLRVCLRVLEPLDSQDILGTSDGARIRKNEPGRAVARLGDGRLVPFQSGYLGNPVTMGGAPGVTLHPFGVVDAGDPPLRGADGRAPTAPSSPTALQVLVQAARAASETMQMPPLRRPWVPPLPAVVTVDELRVGADSAGIPIGLLDLPAEQRQDPLLVDLALVGNLMITGPPRSGRTSVLRTLAGAAADVTSPTDLHIYGIECRGRSLGDLERLPHCGGVVAIDDVDRLDRLLGLLAARIAEHHDTMGTTAPDEPRLILLCDNYETFFERFAYEDGGRLVERLSSIISTGPPRGVHTVLATDRRGLVGRSGVAVEARVVLRPVDRDDQVALGLPHGVVDPAMPAGRGYWYAGPAEVQMALLDAAPRGEAQVAAIDRIASRWPLPSGSSGPRRVAPAPRSISMAEANARRVSTRLVGPTIVTPAVGGVEMVPIDIDLAAAGSAFVVAGPRGSGRTTALVTIVECLRDAAAPLPLCLVAPRRSTLQDLDLPVLSDLDTMATDLAAAVERVDGRLALVIDDAEMLLDNPVSARLDRIVRVASDRDGVVVLGVTLNDLARRFSGWMFDARQSRSGLLLAPSGPTDGEVFDIRLPRSVGAGAPPPPGRGVLVVRGEWMPAQTILNSRLR
jgi:S-DNA-T family DNA segregation ATPase FtsK/SpoIIIE